MINLSLLPKKSMQEIHFHRMDCLMRNKLGELRKKALTPSEVKSWFHEMPDAWKHADNRIERMENAVRACQ
jgi:hypothetical protein